MTNFLQLIEYFSHHENKTHQQSTSELQISKGTGKIQIDHIKFKYN